MNEKASVLYKNRANILKALAHPTRLFIVDLLAKNSLCVCHIHEKINADFSTVSRHLSVLKNAGILLDEKRGNQVFYHLRCPCLNDLFGCLESVMKTSQNASKTA